MVYYSNMNKKSEHGIQIFIVKFMQKNYHSGNITFISLDFRDKDMTKSA